MEEVSVTNEIEDEEIPSNGDMSNEESRNEPELENRMDANEPELVPPKPGMVFDSFEELFQYYKAYGKQEGFGVRKKTSACSSDGKTKYVTVSCSRSGKTQSSIKRNPLKPNPIPRTECKARVNATVFLENGLSRVNSIVLDHNHNFSPSNPRFYLCNRETTRGARRKLELHDKAGIGVSKNFNSFVVEAGGHENVSILAKDCRNYIEKARRLRLGVGDAEAISDYFVKMQSRNSSFFYVMNLDEDARIKNLFWADARSRAAYEEFGDVVTFDTTYLTNRYDVPLAPFVGVNHHGQSILFGCGLVSNEDTGTFIWLFKSWLSCMSGRAPKAIITDQDIATQKAIENVFPNTQHRWCLWHIMKKLPERLSGHSMYDSVKTALQSAVYDSLTQDEFEKNWRVFIEEYNLQKNEWLYGLYDKRHRWVPAFVKSTFWAGMSTTQRGESMTAFFDGYVNSKTTLKQFVKQYDNALRSKAEKEHQADFQSLSTWIPCVTHFGLEKQFQAAYTAAKFKEFQMELTGKLYCDVSLGREEAGIIDFEVTEDKLIGEQRKQLIFKVCFNSENCEAHCSCRLFEFRGIICKHAISVLIKKQVELVPSLYILPRWRKDLKRCHTRVKIGYDDLSADPEARRYDKLHKIFEQAADFAVDSDDKCSMLTKCMLEMIDKLKQK